MLIVFNFGCDDLQYNYTRFCLELFVFVDKQMLCSFSLLLCLMESQLHRWGYKLF